MIATKFFPTVILLWLTFTSLVYGQFFPGGPTNVFKPPSQPSGNSFAPPFGQQNFSPVQQSQSSGNPFAPPFGQQNFSPGQQPQPPRNPFAEPPGNPFAQPPGNPFSQPPGNPFAQQSGNPSAQPFRNPFAQPNGQQNISPGQQPQPFRNPFAQPSGNPFAQPSQNPFAQPSGNPFSQPSGNPFAQPSGNPFAQPSRNPFAQPSRNPFTQQSGNPFTQLSTNPFAQPFNQPNLPRPQSTGLNPNPLETNPQNSPQIPNFNPLPPQGFPPDFSSLFPPGFKLILPPENQPTPFTPENPVPHEPVFTSQRPLPQDSFVTRPQQTHSFSSQPTAPLSTPPEVTNPSTSIYQPTNPSFTNPQQDKPSYTSPQESVPTSSGTQQTTADATSPQLTNSTVPESTDSVSTVPQQTTSDSTVSQPADSNSAVSDQINTGPGISEQTKSDSQVPQPTESDSIVPEQTHPDSTIPQATESDSTIPQPTDSDSTRPQKTNAASDDDQQITSASETSSSLTSPPQGTSSLSSVPQRQNHPARGRTSQTQYRPRFGKPVYFQTSGDPLKGIRIVCLFNNRHFYKTGFTPAKLEPHLCTHLNYEFAVLDPKTYEMITGEPDLDIEMNFYEEATGLKRVNPKLKVLMSLGGWSDSTKKYSELADDKTKRDNFIEKAIDFLTKHGFDGMDLAWEYPNCWQGAIGVSPKDKQNFVTFLKEIKTAFKQHGLLLSVSVGAVKREVEAAYNVPEISKTVDYINVMTYDMHGPWEATTSHHVQFEPLPGDTDKYCNVKGGMQVWIEKGANKKKLNMGLACYGRTFRLKNPNQCAMGVPALGPGAPGPRSKEGGIMSYYEICNFLNIGNWTEKEDKHAGFYACSGDQWAAYDPPMMMVRKAKYVVEYGLGGVLLKDLSGDDTEGECFNMPFPLLKMIRLEIIHKVRQRYYS